MILPVAGSIRRTVSMIREAYQILLLQSMPRIGSWDVTGKPVDFELARSRL